MAFGHHISYQFFFLCSPIALPPHQTTRIYDSVGWSVKMPNETASRQLGITALDPDKWSARTLVGLPMGCPPGWLDAGWMPGFTVTIRTVLVCGHRWVAAGIIGTLVHGVHGIVAIAVVLVDQALSLWIRHCGLSSDKWIFICVDYNLYMLEQFPLGCTSSCLCFVVVVAAGAAATRWFQLENEWEIQ